MIKFLTHNEIDKKKWDACIDHAYPELPYAYSWFLDEVAPQWHALVLNDFEAVMPLPTVKKWFTMAYQPFFVQQLGVYNINENPNFEIIDFLTAIPSEYRYINICLNENNSVYDPSIKTVKRPNYVLHLHQPFNAIAKGFNNHTKRQIKKSSLVNSSIEICNFKDVIFLYQKELGKETPYIKQEDYSRLINICDVLERREMLECWCIKKDGEITSSAIFIKHRNRLIYYMGASTETGKENRDMFKIFEFIIKKFAGNNYALDFEGSEISGVARFFSGFGALKLSYQRIIINRLPFPLNWLKK
ncbi:MAG: hypothetical protein MUC81_00590 [Bacteroidia bacterium]|nr:hypothetical protein [Bacteroidia bacterium]